MSIVVSLLKAEQIAQLPGRAREVIEYRKSGLSHADATVFTGLHDVRHPHHTRTLAKRMLPGQPGYRLGTLVQALNLAEGLPDDLTPHRAAYDALVTARLFVRLAAVTGGDPLTLEGL